MYDEAFIQDLGPNERPIPNFDDAGDEVLADPECDLCGGPHLFSACPKRDDDPSNP